MKEIFITLDVEPDLHTNKYLSVKALPEFISILEKHKVKVTFFTTCDCIEKFPKIFREIKKRGHKVELHGYRHKRVDAMDEKEARDSIEKSIKYFKKHLKTTPKGFRAPQHSIDEKTLTILKNNGFLYDSSITPWNFYHLIFFWKIHVNPAHHFRSMKMHKFNGLVEIPISSFFLPFSSFTLRILPKPLLKIYFWVISLYKNPVYFMHSWDLIELKDSKIYNLCKKDRFLEKFEYMLEYFKEKRDFSILDKLANPV